MTSRRDGLKTRFTPPGREGGRRRNATSASWYRRLHLRIDRLDNDIIKWPGKRNRVLVNPTALRIICPAPPPTSRRLRNRDIFGHNAALDLYAHVLPRAMDIADSVDRFG